MDMPQPNPDVLARKVSVLARLRQVLPEDAIIADPSETRAYECDALTAYKCAPMIAVPLIRAIHEGARSVAQLGACTGAGTNCGSCKPELARLIQSAAPAAGIANEKESVR